MSNELTYHSAADSGDTLYAQLENAVGQLWNGSAFEAPVSGNWGDYDIAMTEQATSTGIFRASMPAAGAGAYSFIVRKQAGGSPAVGDIVRGTGRIQWGGASEIPLGDCRLLVSTTIDAVVNQTEFSLSAGSPDNDAYNECTIVVEDASNPAQKAVGVIGDYAGTPGLTVTLKSDPGIFTMASGDKVYILADTVVNVNEIEGVDATDQITTAANAALDTAINELSQGIPTATPTLRTGLMLLYMPLRNQFIVQTSATDAIEVYNDAGTKIAKKVISDDGDDYTEAKMTSGA